MEISHRLIALQVLIALSVAFAASCARTGTVNQASLPPPLRISGSERVSFRSALLDKEMGIYVHLPPGYDPSREYPTVYLLHGFGNTEIEWFDYYGMDAVADRLVADGTITPMILVAVRMDNSWGSDTGKPRQLSANPRVSLYAGQYESYLLREVIPLVECRYPAHRDAASRCIAGVSMGGYAALHIGLRNQRTFGTIAAHSPALRGPNVPEWFLYSKERTADRNDPIILAGRNRQGGTRLWLDCGESDGLLPGVVEMRDALVANGWKIEYSIEQGAHDARYWTNRLEDYLAFYADAASRRR